MLRRNLPLTLRAALIFGSIYVVTFFGGLMLLSAAALRVGSERHHAGANIALTFAIDELRIDEGALQFPADGTFASLATRNPAAWVLVETRGRQLTFGRLPEAAGPLLGRFSGVVEATKFHMPGQPRPLSDSAAASIDTLGGKLLVAVGGIDPATITFGDSFRYFLREGLFAILLVVGVVGLIAMLVALPLLTAALKPMTAEAGAIRPEAPDRRIDEARVPRELLPLVRSFNAALDRLANELVRRKRFVADVAHELRTPLSIVSLQLDNLKDSEGREELRRIVGRMTHLVGQMLDVERLSLAGQGRSQIDLAALAEDVVADMAPMALSAGYDLSLERPAAPVPVAGDPHALGRAVGSLIGNAVAHGGGQGQIKVVVGEARTVDVIDEGPGVTDAIRDTLFEPFSRARWDRDGCGLGLHLTREIMRAHGGDALLLPTSSGAGFRIQFREP